MYFSVHNIFKFYQNSVLKNSIVFNKPIPGKLGDYLTNKSAFTCNELYKKNLKKITGKDDNEKH